MLMFTILQYKETQIIREVTNRTAGFVLCFQVTHNIKRIQKYLVIVASHGFPVDKYSNCFRILCDPRGKETWSIPMYERGMFETISLFPWHCYKLQSGALSVFKL